MKKIIIMLTVLFSNAVMAGAGWTGYGKITELNQQPGTQTADVYIKATLPSNLSGCSDTTGYILSVQNARDERTFTMLLSAFMAGKEVRLYFTGECHKWNVAMVAGVYIR